VSEANADALPIPSRDQTAGVRATAELPTGQTRSCNLNQHAGSTPNYSHVLTLHRRRPLTRRLRPG
jgi:hypothetical protein